MAFFINTWLIFCYAQFWIPGALSGHLRAVDAPPTVTVKNGTYVGVHNANYNEYFFLGIPYAQPPVGDLRFNPPASLNTSFAGTINATAYSPECLGYGVFYLIFKDRSEEL